MALLDVVIIVAVLRFAREIFIPFALAILFSFLLAPLVNRLRHWRVPRTAAVFIVVILAFSVVGFIGALMASQMVDLAKKFPQYEQNIRHKVESLVAGQDGMVMRVTKTFQNLRADLMPPAANPTQNQTTQPGVTKPVPVEIRSSEFSPMQMLRRVLGSAFGIFTTAFIVIVFVIFMLVERDDLRNRVIRLMGMRKPNFASQLLDDTGRRVTRYLLMQFIVNVSYGILVGVGLLFIGVPNPLLWGAFTALLRYIPYAGTWIAASLPFALALAIDPDWTKPLLVVGLFVAMEIIVANVIEPWVYGASGGITPFAVLAAAVFWTWVWGPVGLLLSTPLTVCLVSMGRHIPSLEFLDVLFGDEPHSTAIAHDAAKRC
ncbi:MAG: hypothetical protein JWR19_2262 [Pedosphaera sp.]|nr:hypothetical protein [Pedosphaera sp.]